MTVIPLVYLVVSSVFVYSYPIRRQISSPPAPSSTLNDSWLFPPVATTTTAANNVIPDHITLVVPSPSNTSTDSDSDSSTTTISSPSVTTTVSSSPITTSTISSTPAPSLSTTNVQQTRQTKFHKILFFYLIPILSFVGLICLSVACWLIYGCCTRRPKYRRASQRGYEKEWDSSSDDGEFKAFRYEEFTSTVPDVHHIDETPRICQHSHEFGFKCDCDCRRQSVVERELFKDWFKWPSVREGFEGIREGDTERKQDYTRSPDISLYSRTTTPLVSPATTTTPLPSPTANAEAGNDTMGRQTKLFESVQIQERKLKTRPRGKLVKRKKKNSRDGFRMIVEEVEDGGEEQDRPGRGSWLGKMVSRISSGSSIGKDVEDRYTALPDPDSQGVCSSHRSKSKSTEPETNARMNYSSPPYPPTHPYLPHRHRPHQPYVALPSNSNLSLDPDTNITSAHLDDTDLSREIARQKERLAKHRESIASLPAGMVYSPPLVGVCMFDGHVEGKERVWF